MKKTAHTFGAEIEKPVSDVKTLQTHGVSQAFFKEIASTAKKRKQQPHMHFSDLQPKTAVGVTTDDLGEQGLDHGFNILETASTVHTSLQSLNAALWTDVTSTQQALKKEGATVLNFSNHPFGKTDLQTYQQFAAPKGVYPYMWSRGWNFTASINANAQNSPATGVSVKDAAQAVSAIIGIGAANIGLFGNSPIVRGEISGYKESRVTMWDTVMQFSKSPGDRLTSTFPKEKFETLAQYFSWMFGEGTNMHFTVANAKDTSDYKGIGQRILLSPQNPSVLEYLSKPSWEMYYFKDLQQNFPFKTIENVKPSIADLEVLQWAQFIGARIRFGLKNHANFPLTDFVTACQHPKSKTVEKIFETFATYTYIEGRDPGANFSDTQLWEAGEEIANSVLIAPSALQKGLLRNLTATTAYLNTFAWEDLGKLRNAAIKDGLQGKVGKTTVLTFSQHILKLAQEGLSSEEQAYLAYPQWVLHTKQNGADRALTFLKAFKGSEKEALTALVKSRAVLVK